MSGPASATKRRAPAGQNEPQKRKGTIFDAFRLQNEKKEAAAAAAEAAAEAAKRVAAETQAKDAADAERFDRAVKALVERIVRMPDWSSVHGLAMVTEKRKLPFDDPTTQALARRDKKRLEQLQHDVNLQEILSLRGGRGAKRHEETPGGKNKGEGGAPPQVCFCGAGCTDTLRDLQTQSFYHTNGRMPLYDPESPCSKDPEVCGVHLASVVKQLGEKTANTCGWDVWELKTTRGEVLKVREFKPVLPQLLAITGVENHAEVALHTFGIEEREYGMQLRTFELEKGQITLWVEEQQEGGFDPLESLENVGGMQRLVEKHPKVRDLAVFQTASKDGDHRAVVNSLKETLWRLTSPEVLNLFGLLSFVEQFGLAPPPLAQAALQVFQERVNAADDFSRVDKTYVKAVHTRSIMKCPGSLKQDFLNRMWFRTPIVLERIDCLPSAPWCPYVRPGTKCLSLH